MKYVFLKPLYVLILGLFFCSLFLTVSSVEKGEIYNYNGIPGCRCFINCACGTRYENPFENDYKRSSKDYEDHYFKKSNAVWHSFLDKLHESWNGGPSTIYINHLFGLDNRRFNMLSEYLNAVEDYKKDMRKEANKFIKFDQKEIDKINNDRFFKDLVALDKLKKSIEKTNEKLAHSLKVLSSIPEEIIPLYYQIISSCPHKGAHNLALTYNEGFFGFITGDYETSLEKINEFVVFAETSESHKALLDSKIYQTQGESLLEVGLYHEAIVVLTKAIEQDSTNKEAYFSRAAAHFETGDFDLAVFDYLSSEAKKDFAKVEAKVSDKFSSALMSAVLEGGKESAIEFVPSLCSTAYGLGECLWSFAQQPQDAAINFCNACYEAGSAVTDYIRNLDQEKIEGLADEVLQVYQKFDSLSDAEKGQAIGYCVGKYGVDIFAGGATFKCVSAVKNLKNANRLCNLEALAASEANREAMTIAALKHAAERESFFKNVRIHWDKQNKHVPGKHNFEKGRGTILLEVEEFEVLVKNHVGTGAKVTGNFGSSVYKERVDFGKIIGEYALKVEGQPTRYFPTTNGIITYAKDGSVHVFPSRPSLFVE
jgi:tetratricopeptide (TPR) repeat protein